MVKNLPAMWESQGWIPRWGRSPREGYGYLPQCSGLENSLDRGAWGAKVCEVAKSPTGLSDLTLSLEGTLCMILNDPNAGSKVTVSKPERETPKEIMDFMKRNMFWTFLPQIVGMICGWRKYSSKYGMVRSLCNMSLVSQGKGLTGSVAPWKELTHPVSTFLPPRLG